MNTATNRQFYINRYVQMYRANLDSKNNFFLSGLFELENILVNLFGVPRQHMEHMRQKLSGSTVQLNQDTIPTQYL